MEQKFLNGLFVKRKHERAPAFVVCVLSIKREELIKSLQEMDEEFINLDVKETKDGSKYYAQINTYKKDQQSAPKVESSNDFGF